MPEVADGFRRDGGASLAWCGQDLLPSPRRALDDRVPCRTEAFGGPLWPCDPWGPAHDLSHACRHRSGPTCHPQDTEAWREARRQARLPAPDVQVVLPLPPELRALGRRRPQDLDARVLRAVAQALMKLA